MPKSTSSRINPPRPMNCFLLFRNDKQKEIVAKCKGANHRDISKVISKWWRESDEELKTYYRIRAIIEKEKHQQMYPNYKYSPKKKDGPKRPYIRRTLGTVFTSRTEENNKLLERMYESVETSTDLNGKHQEFKISPTEIINKKSSTLSKVQKLCKESHDPKRRERHSSAPLMSNQQDYSYVHPSLSPPKLSAPSSSSSVGYPSPYSTLSPSTSFHVLPSMYPTEQLYTCYDPTSKTYPGLSDYVNQTYMQTSHSNNSYNSDLVFINYSGPQYTTSSPPYHLSLNYVDGDCNYVAPVSTDAYGYPKGAGGCINPVLLGMP